MSELPPLMLSSSNRPMEEWEYAGSNVQPSDRIAHIFVMPLDLEEKDVLSREHNKEVGLISLPTREEYDQRLISKVEYFT